jgi:hypothetical protein
MSAAWFSLAWWVSHHDRHTHTHTHTTPARLVAGLAAMLLLAGASFKAWSLYFGITVAEALFSSPTPQVALIQFELILALWLLSGWRARAARGFAALTFTVFAATSLYLALQGRASCGCFGTLSINPWLMFAVDVVMAALLLAMNARNPMKAQSAGDGLGFTLAGASGFQSGVAGVLIIGAIYYGLVLAGHDPVALLARLRGDLVTVTPPEVDIGSGQARESVTALVTLRNVGDQPVKIIGGSSDCSCITTADLPVSIAPGHAQSIHVTVKRTGNAGVQRRKYLLYTDCPKQPRVFATLVGRVE